MVELAGVEAGRMSLVEVEVEVGGAFADCSSLPGLKP